MKHSFFLSLIFSLISFIHHAQITASDAELFDKPGANKIIALGENIELYTGAADGSWFYTRVILMVSKADVENDIIASGAEVYDVKGVSLGKLGGESRVVEKSEALGRKHRDKYVVVMEGYVLKTRLKEESHPELELEKILQMRGQNSEAIEEWIKKFNAKRFTKNGMIQYVVYEENYTLEDEKSFRIILHFKDANRIYAVSTHRQKIYIPKVKAQLEDNEIHHYFPSNKPTDSDQNTIKEIAITFLAL